MHIHYLSTSTLISDTANSVHVMKMCQAFAKTGHEVTLYGQHGYGSSDEIYAYYGIQAPFTICRYNERAKGFASLLWLFRTKLPFLRVGGLPSYFFALQYIRPLFSKLSLSETIVYGRNIYWLLALSKKVPFIVERHHPPANKIEILIERELYRRKSCKRVVVISEKLKEIYLSFFPEIEKKIVIAHDAADDPFVSSDFKINEKPNIKKIGYVGHLYAGRGIDIIIKIAKKLEHFEFHILGGKPESITKIKDTYTPPSNLIFHGHKPHSELTAFYKDFDAVLAPYQKKVTVGGDTGDTSAFMSPLKIFEYMSYGIPLVCSDMPVLREVLKDGTNALLVKPDAPSDWVDAILKLNYNKVLRDKISQSARQDFEKMYSWNNRAKKVLDSLDID